LRMLEVSEPIPAVVVSNRRGARIQVKEILRHVDGLSIEVGLSIAARIIRFLKRSSKSR